MKMRYEDEDYGEETRDLIEGLRRLAGGLETPPELRPRILARAQELLPCNRSRASRWYSMLSAWRPHPLVWGPVVAVACFMAGMLFSPTQLGTWRDSSIGATQETAHKRRTAAAPPSVAKEEAQPQPAAPSVPSLAQHDVARQRPETRIAAERSATSERELVPQERRQLRSLATHDAPSAAAMSRPSPASPHPPVEVTTLLPAALYERLVQEAQRRHQDPSTLVHEAVEAYLRGAKPGE
jgi:hypothetical protein